MNENNSYLFDKYNLAAFLCEEYYSRYNRDITPIKLHKGLYFLFAFYGQKVMTAQEGKDIEDPGFKDLPLYLFDADFRLWHYGPVENDVYYWFKYNCRQPYSPGLKPLYKIGCQEEVIRYLRELSGRIFATSDFGLVDLAKEDRCCKKPASKQLIDKDEILKEYAENPKKRQ